MDQRETKKSEQYVVHAKKILAQGRARVERRKRVSLARKGAAAVTANQKERKEEEEIPIIGSGPRGRGKTFFLLPFPFYPY